MMTQEDAGRNLHRFLIYIYTRVPFFLYKKESR